MDADIDRITRAIDTICADDAASLVDAQIAELETRLAKLKKIRKVLGVSGSDTEKKTVRWILDEKLEGKVVALIEKNGPMKSSDLAMKIPGVSALNIGRMVTASKMLVRNGDKLIEVRE